MKKLLGSIVMALALLAFAVQTHAQNAPAESFSITNAVGHGTNYTTAGVTGVGNPINVDNYTDVGFVYEGTGTTANNGNIIITIVRSTKASPPTRTNDLENLTPITLTVPTSGTAYIQWITNASSAITIPARWFVVTSITNSSSDNTMTNVSLKVVKKIQPIRYP
jgi:hypothetical protein